MEIHYQGQNGGCRRRFLEAIHRDARHEEEAAVLAFITADELAAWWKTRCGHLGWKTRNGTRGSLVGFRNWCVWATWHPNAVPPADCLPRAAPEKHERRVLSPEEFKALAAAGLPQYRSSIVLQAFCGFRPEEAAPLKRKGISKKSKRGIRRVFEI